MYVYPYVSLRFWCNGRNSAGTVDVWTEEDLARRVGMEKLPRSKDSTYSGRGNTAVTNVPMGGEALRELVSLRSVCACELLNQNLFTVMELLNTEYRATNSSDPK